MIKGDLNLENEMIFADNKQDLLFNHDLSVDMNFKIASHEVACLASHVP